MILEDNGIRPLLRTLPLALCVLIAGCRSPQAAPPSGGDPVVQASGPAESALSAQAYLDRSLKLARYTPEQLDQIARCPVAIFPLRLLLSPEGRRGAEQLRRRNPEILLLGVHQVLSLPEVWNHPNQRKRFPLAADLYDLLAPHKASTSTGDVAWRWPGNVMVDPWTPTGFNQDLLRQRLDILETHMKRYAGIVDGIFHDYLSPTPFLFAGKDVEILGHVDMDGDGTAAQDDEDEQRVWQDWQVALLRGWQQRFGDDWIQIANGQLGHDDADVAGLLAGIAYEFFPHLPWKLSDREGLERLIAHHQPGYLTPRRGRLWSLIWDTQGTNLEFCRVASMLTGQFYVRTERHGFVAVDPQSGTVALGDLRRESLADGGVRFVRAFDSGQAEIRFDRRGVRTDVGFARTQTQR